MNLREETQSLFTLVPLIEQDVSFIGDNFPLALQLLDVVVVEQVPLAISRVPTGGGVVTSLQVAAVVVAHCVQVVQVETLARLITAHRRLTKGPANSTSHICVPIVPKNEHVVISSNDF